MRYDTQMRAASTLIAMPVPLATTSAHAADSLRAVPCRPTVACTADLAAPGVVELETGYTGRLVNGTWQAGVPFLLKTTVVEWLQVQVGGSGNFVAGNEWFDNLVA